MHKYIAIYMDGNDNYISCQPIYMPELTHYGYDGSDDTYASADKVYNRELMRRAKKAVGITGKRGTVENYGYGIIFSLAYSDHILTITNTGE